MSLFDEEVAFAPLRDFASPKRLEYVARDRQSHGSIAAWAIPTRPALQSIRAGLPVPLLRLFPGPRCVFFDRRRRRMEVCRNA